MAIRSKHTWYVSFEAPPAQAGEKRPYSRTTRTFQNEGEAKDFAREKLQTSREVSAGTLNPFLPKRVIISAQMYEWLEASLRGDGKDLVQTMSSILPGEESVAGCSRTAAIGNPRVRERPLRAD
jgi:hypothetical protein